jgi:hypothetical protein
MAQGCRTTGVVSNSYWLLVKRQDYHKEINITIMGRMNSENIILICLPEEAPPWTLPSYPFESIIARTLLGVMIILKKTRNKL